MTDKPLSPKQIAFCREYTVDRNGAQAAIRAGYSKNGAKESASRLLTYHNIKQEMARIDNEQAEIGHRTVAGVDKMYQAGYNVAQTQKNAAAMATNTTGIARLYGMDKDAGSDHEDAPGQLTEAEIDMVRKMSKAVTEQRLGPVLAKEAV